MSKNLTYTKNVNSIIVNTGRKDILLGEFSKLMGRYYKNSESWFIPKTQEAAVLKILEEYNSKFAPSEKEEKLERIQKSVKQKPDEKYVPSDNDNSSSEEDDKLPVSEIIEAPRKHYHSARDELRRMEERERAKFREEEEEIRKRIRAEEEERIRGEERARERARLMEERDRKMREEMLEREERDRKMREELEQERRYKEREREREKMERERDRRERERRPAEEDDLDRKYNDVINYYRSFAKNPKEFREAVMKSVETSDEESSSSDDFPSPSPPKKNKAKRVQKDEYDDLFGKMKEIQKRLIEMERRR